MSSMDELTWYGIVHQVPILQAEGLDYMEDYLKTHSVSSFLEIGTAIGRTALRAAKINPNCRIITIERKPEMIQEARKNFEKYDTAHQIELIEGDARVVPIPARTFDCIFIDAAKNQYRTFFERFAPMLEKDGVIISDNMNFHGMVDHPERTNNRHTRALLRRIREYREFLASLEDYETEFLEIGDGIAVTRRKNTDV